MSKLWQQLVLRERWKAGWDGQHPVPDHQCMPLWHCVQLWHQRPATTRPACD